MLASFSPSVVGVVELTGLKTDVVLPDLDVPLWDDGPLVARVVVWIRTVGCALNRYGQAGRIIERLSASSVCDIDPASIRVTYEDWLESRET
jgi:hypothetical protein